MAGSWLGRALARGRGVPDEAELVRQAQRGSEDALAALFDLHWPRLFRAALAVTADAAAAEDVAQEAFIAAVGALDRFDRSRPFGPWLHRIAVNRAIDHARARAARRELGAEGLPEPGVPPAEPGGADRVAALVAGAAAGAAGRRRPALPAGLHARARSPTCSSSRAAPSTRACAAASTRSPSASGRRPAP